MMTNWSVVGSLVVCALGPHRCTFRPLDSVEPLASLFAFCPVLLVWINLGGLHGGIGPLPAALILVLSPKSLSNPRSEAVGYLMIGFSFFSIAMVFLAYWICSKSKTLGQSP